MKAFVCALASVVFLGGILQAEDKVPKPSPLVQLTSASVKGGELIGHATETVTEYFEQVKTEIINGKVVTVTEKVPVLKSIQVARAYPLKNAKATSLDGKEIAADDLAAKIKDAKVVVVFPTASKPSERAIKSYAEGTLLIELLDKK